MTLLSKEVHLATPASQEREMEVCIASISDQDWYITRTYGVFHIPACPKGEAYAFIKVIQRHDTIDLGDTRRFPYSISARDIATDITQDLGDHGVFVCAGEMPSEDELQKARVRRDAWYAQLIQEADQMWARGHSYREISDMHRRAALAMGIEREWAYVPKPSLDCPVCGEKLRHGAAMCRHCGAVLDAARVARFKATGSRMANARTAD